MARIREAKVKDEIIPLEPFKYNVLTRLNLPSYDNDDSNTFLEVIESRSSRRDFSNIPLQKLGPLFYFSSRTKCSTTNDYGLVIEKRNSPSCGAMHTIDCMVSKFESDIWYVYNSRSHTFDRLNVNASLLKQFKRECKALIDCSDSAYLIWYVCDMDRLNCKYENAESLALRESGALAAIQSLIAENYGLAFCMLGVIGGDQAKIFSNQRNLVGVGVAVVGGNVDFI
jgi:hypothetical protein